MKTTYVIRKNEGEVVTATFTRQSGSSHIDIRIDGVYLCAGGITPENTKNWMLLLDLLNLREEKK